MRLRIGVYGQSYLVENCDSFDSSAPVFIRGLRSNLFAKFLAEVCDRGAAKLDRYHVMTLDQEAHALRRQDQYPLIHEYVQFSQLLRTLGDFLDRQGVTNFRVAWSAAALASVEFQLPDLNIDSRVFTMEKLQKLCTVARYQRARATNVQLPRHFGSKFSYRG